MRGGKGAFSRGAAFHSPPACNHGRVGAGGLGAGQSCLLLEGVGFGFCFCVSVGVSDHLLCCQLDILPHLLLFLLILTHALLQTNRLISWVTMDSPHRSSFLSLPPISSSYLCCLIVFRGERGGCSLSPSLSHDFSSHELSKLVFLRGSRRGRKCPVMGSIKRLG